MKQKKPRVRITKKRKKTAVYILLLLLLATIVIIVFSVQTEPQELRDYAAGDIERCIGGDCVSDTENNSIHNPQILDFRVRFAGVDGSQAHLATMTVRFEQSIHGVPENKEIFVTPPITVSHIGNGLYRALVTLSNTLPESDSYALYVKGEKHMAIKFCHATGQTAPCGPKSTSAISIRQTREPQVFDFSGIALPPGDLPPQDGRADDTDMKLITARLDTPCSALSEKDIHIADVNYDGCINVKDAYMVRQTQYTVYENQ